MKLSFQSRHSHLNRIEALPQTLFISDDLDDKSSQSASRDTISAMTLYFVDSFRKFVNFDIPALDESHQDYHEFGHDPKIPLLNFVERIIQTTNCGFSALPGAIVLLKRLLSSHPELVISINNMHRLLLVALLTASKFLEDVPAANQLFATGSRFSIADLLELELEFLALLNYNPFISRSEFCEVLNSWGFKVQPKQ
jgi:hypothetical protein